MTLVRGGSEGLDDPLDALFWFVHASALLRQTNRVAEFIRLGLFQLIFHRNAKIARSF